MRTLPSTYAEARELADAARAKAYARRDLAVLKENAHRAYQRAQLRQRWWQVWRPVEMPLSIPFDHAVDRRLARDAVYLGAIADNRWYIDQAIMYGQGEILASLSSTPADPDVSLTLDGEGAWLTTAGLPRRNPE